MEGESANQTKSRRSYNGPENVVPLSAKANIIWQSVKKTSTNIRGVTGES